MPMTALLVAASINNMGHCIYYVMSELLFELEHTERRFLVDTLFLEFGWVRMNLAPEKVLRTNSLSDPIGLHAASTANAIAGDLKTALEKNCRFIVARMRRGGVVRDAFQGMSSIPEVILNKPKKGAVTPFEASIDISFVHATDHQKVHMASASS